MDAKWASSLKDLFRVGVTAFAVAVIWCFAGSATFAQQQAAVDVQIGSGDRILSDATTIEAEAGQTVVIEVFATGWSGVQGLNASFVFDDITMIDGMPTLAGGSAYPIGLPALTDNQLNASYAIFGAPPTESGSDLKFIGNVTFNLSSTFTSLTITFTQLSFGGSILPVGTVLTIASPGTLPKSFFADLNGSPGNQNVVQGRANPGGRFQVQTFAGGLSDVDEIEIQVDVDTDQIIASATGFIPNSRFVVVAGAGGSGSDAGGLPDTAPSSFANVDVDIQNAPDGTHTPDGLAITAEGGSTVSVEIFGSGYEGANGITVLIRVSDPSAIQSLTSTPSSHFNIKLSEPSIDGDLITMNIGNLSPPSSAPFALVATLNIELAAEFNGLALEVTSVDFAPTDLMGSPSAVLTITPPGGVSTGGSLGSTRGSSFANAEFDIQNTPNGSHDSGALSVTAAGGSTVSVEVFGSGYEGANGVSVLVEVSDPSAISGLTSTASPHFNIKLSEPSINGNVIELNIGNLSPPSSAPFALVATLNIELASNFNGLTLNVTSINFAPSGVMGNPDAFMTIVPPGGVQAPAPPLVAVDGGTITLRLQAQTPVSGDVALGRFVFETTRDFRQTDLTFSSVTFISAQIPVGIEPNLVVSVRSTLSNAPTVSEPPVLVTVTDTRVLIRWVTNRAGTGRITYGTESFNLDQEVTQDGSGRLHLIGITGLQLGTRYFYKVITTDTAGNESDPFPERPLIFVTRRRPDTLPPRIVRGPSPVGITTNAVTILVATNEASTIDILYGSSAEDLSQTASSTTESKIHEITLTGLTAGKTIFFKTRATDLIGNTATTPNARQFRLRSVADASAPRILGRPTILGVTFKTAVIRWLTTEPSSSVVRFGLGGTFSDSSEASKLVKGHNIALSNLLADTTYSYLVESVDASGNTVTSPTFLFRTRDSEDTTLPRIVRPPVVVRRSNTEALIVFRTNEPSTVTIQVDSDIEVASDTTGVLGDSFSTTTAARRQEVLLTGLDPATVYFYRIAVTDLTGNGPTYNVGQLSFATLSVADSAGPIVFSRPVALGITEEGASINWAADEPHTAIIRFRVASAAKQVGDFDELIEDLELSRRHAVPIAGLELGTTYEYEVETTDAEGNASTTGDLTFTTRSGADTDAPSIVRGPRVTNITASTVTVEWGTDEPADTRVHWGSTIEYDETIEVAEGIRFHSLTLTDLEAATLYHYAVGSADGSGNIVTTDASGTTIGLSQDHTFRTLSTEDANPPVITEGPLAEIRNNLVILKWRTDELSTSRVTVGVLPGSDDASIEGTPVFGETSEIVFEENFLTRRHVVTVTGLTPGLDYFFQVSSTDAAGNAITSFDPTISPKIQPPGGFGSFTTTTEEDTQFPVITSGPTIAASTSESLTIEWSTDESSNGTIDFGTSETDLSAQEVTGTNETTHRLVLTKLATGTTYAYQVGSTDASGNGATKSAVVFGTTAASEDLTAPVISGTPSIIYVNDRQATISWQTSEAADSEVAFGTTPDELLEIRNDSEFNADHTITLTNLSAATTYYYTVSSTDQSNNGPAISSVLEFATEALPDTAPPTTSEITSSATDAEAIITWTTDELSDSAVRFGTQSGSLGFNTGASEDVLSHSIALTNLQPSTTYTFTVASIDRAGNQGTTSSEQTFTTLAEGEVPTLAAPTGLAATAGNAAVQLSWTASTSGGVVGVIVERDPGDGSFQAIATLDDATSYIDNNVENEVSYIYQIRAVGLNDVQSDASTASGTVTPAAGIGPSTPILAMKQGNPLQPTFVINNSTPLNEGEVLNYTFQLSSQSDYSDAITLDSGLAEGAGIGSSDPSGLTAWTVDRELDDGTTYYYRIKSSDGTFDSDFLTGQFTANSADLPYPGDIDGDLTVGFGDFLSLVGTFNKVTGDDAFILEADFNNDGAVNFADFLTFVGAFGTVFVTGEDASTKPVAIAMTYGIDTGTRLEMVGLPMSSKTGGELIVEIHAKDALDLLGIGLRISYDTDALEFVEAFQGSGGMLNSDETKAEMFATLEHDAAKGNVFVAAAITEGGAVAGDGVISRLRFVLKTDQPQGDLINLVEGLIIDGKLNVNSAQNLGARLSLLPENFTLDHNFPNPFNPETTIRYAIPEASRVRLVVYNVLGQEVIRLVDKDQTPGFYALRWDGKDSFGRGVASGVYLYKIQANGETQKFSQIHKMLLLK